MREVVERKRRFKEMDKADYVREVVGEY
jgi:hypothetical protein